MAFHLPADMATWMAQEWQDYVNPQNWSAKKNSRGAQTFKKEDHGKIPHYKVTGVIPTRLERVVNVIHTNASTYDKHLDPSTIQSKVLQKITKEQLGGLADEGVVYYRQAKLPMVDNRDFVTLTLMKVTYNPNTNRRVVAFFTRSVDHPSVPASVSGFQRAHVQTCCAFLEETPQGVNYTLTNKTDTHIKMFSSAVAHGLESFMLDYFGRLSQVACTV